jgi:hypothetical protein
MIRPKKYGVGEEVYVHPSHESKSTGEDFSIILKRSRIPDEHRRQAERNKIHYKKSMKGGSPSKPMTYTDQTRQFGPPVNKTKLKSVHTSSRQALDAAHAKRAYLP